MLKPISEMSRNEKERVIDIIWDRNNIIAGSGEIKKDYVIVNKFGYRNVMTWKVVAFDFKNKRAKYAPGYPAFT